MSSSLDRLIHSATATAVAEIATLPICTLKTVYQNTRSDSIRQTIKLIYSHNGIKSFYRACYPAVSSQILSTSSKYVLYRKLEDLKLPHTNKIINGIGSGVLASVLTHPVDVIKIHLQMNVKFISALQEHGPKIFYQGYSKSLSKVIVASSLFFPLTDYSLNFTNNNVVVASLFSSVISTMIVHPIDYLKTRHMYGQSLFQGWNPRFYYKGLSLNLLRVVPHFVIVMTGIDVIEKFRFHSSSPLLNS